MRSFGLIALAGGAGSVAMAKALEAPAPVITPAPRLADIVALKRDDPDGVSLAEVLLTAIPESLREIAATNIPAVSSILWSEFLDNNKPTWFTALPTDIQNYLVHKFGPSTAWASTTPSANRDSSAASPSITKSASVSATDSASASASSADSSRKSDSATTASPRSSSKFVTSIRTISFTSPSVDIPIAAPTTTSPTHDAPDASNKPGLSKGQKIGVGVGVPVAALAVAALLFGCCFLWRRRKQRRESSTPPSSPGFIPRFAFQEKNKSGEWGANHPLRGDGTFSAAELNGRDWDDDIMHDHPPSNGVQNGKNGTPLMAPALFHTHSSNRARGTRTSYSSLHSVPEAPEMEQESPVLGRTNGLKRNSPPRISPPRNSPSRSSTQPPVPAAAQVKRKPVGNPSLGQSPAAYLATRGLRQAQARARARGEGDVVSPVSPTENRNPFGNEYRYVEDYGPEFHHNGYKDIETGYSAHPIHPAFRQSQPKSSKTEWPLRNGLTRNHQRTKSPLWDRVYEEER